MVHDTRITTPAVLAEPDASMGLTADQVGELQKARQKFVDDLGGANQNPYDPTYAERWRQAQEESDDFVYATLGQDAFYALQSKVLQGY
jgi:hypothetical protein